MMRFFDIDFWPQVPPYVEVESSSLTKAEDAARLLGFDPKNGFICSAGSIFRRYGIDKDEYSYIGFDKMVKK